MFDSCLAFSELLQNSLALARRITEELHDCLHDFKWDNVGFGVQHTLGTRCLLIDAEGPLSLTSREGRASAPMRSGAKGFKPWVDWLKAVAQERSGPWEAVLFEMHAKMYAMIAVQSSSGENTFPRRARLMTCIAQVFNDHLRARRSAEAQARKLYIRRAR